MSENLKDQLEAAVEALQGALVYRGADSPLWTSLEQSLTELEKALEQK